jgi:hypothetical protein
MRKMSRYLRVAILSLVIFSSFSVSTESYAYWASGIGEASSMATASVLIGEWIETIPEYQSGTYYYAGDQVTYNGNTFQARRNGTLPAPSGWFYWIWWVLIS